MKNIKVIFTPKNPSGCDPLAKKDMVAVKAEINGEKYGMFVEFEDGDATVPKIIDAVNAILDKIQEIYEMNERR